MITDGTGPHSVVEPLLIRDNLVKNINFLISALILAFGTFVFVCFRRSKL